MLTGNNDRALIYKNVNPELFFFYQRWNEMLESRTLDMYQYNILNSYVACIELADVIDKTMSGLLNSRQNIDDAKAEAFEIVKADNVIEKNNRELKNGLLRVLSTKIDSKSRGEQLEDKNSSFFISINRLKYQLKAPIRILADNYMNYLLIEVKNDIDNNDLKQIERHCSLLISQCIFNGWSAKGLFLIAKCFEGQGSLELKWNEFTQSITQSIGNDYEVYCSIKIETRSGIPAINVREIVNSLGLQIKKGSEIISENSTRQNPFSKVNSDKSYIIVRVQSTDLYAAALSAINSLNSRLSVATFYNTISPWIAASPQIVVHRLEDSYAETFNMTDVFKTYDYIDSNNSVFSDTNSILLNPQKEHIIRKLNAAFSYTNLSRSSYFQETKYISLWIALESVMRTGQYPDIISHIKNVLPEILSIRYIYRIIRNFSEDCIRCGFKQCDQLNISMNSLNKRELVSQLIAIFRNPEKYELLKANCRSNKLLDYRCDEIHALLNDTKSISNKFDHYTKKVRWHIQRLYRIRNEITHSAFQDDKSLMIYIEHLYTYLAQLISEVVYYVEHKKSESVEEAFATILESYKTYIDLLKEGKISNENVLPDGIIDIF